MAIKSLTKPARNKSVAGSNEKTFVCALCEENVTGVPYFLAAAMRPAKVLYSPTAPRSVDVCKHCAASTKWVICVDNEE